MKIVGFYINKKGEDVKLTKILIPTSLILLSSFFPPARLSIRLGLTAWRIVANKN